MLDRKLQGTLAFIGLTIFGLIWAISEILGLAGVNPGQTGALIMGIFKGIALLLVVVVVVFVGWEAASEKSSVMKIFYIVVSVLAVLGAILGLISAFR